jgi:hypothetical protein
MGYCPIEDIVPPKTNIVVQQKTKVIVQQKTKVIVQQKTKVVVQQKTKVIVQQKIKVKTKSHTLTKPIPSNTHLIKRGSQSTCNRKLGYHDSCTLCKGKYPVPTHSDFITRRWLENLLSAILYTSFGVWLRDHYMPLQSLTPARMSWFAIGFPLLGTTEYPQAPFIVTNVPSYWVQQNTLRPLLHLAVS